MVERRLRKLCINKDEGTLASKKLPRSAMLTCSYYQYLFITRMILALTRSLLLSAGLKKLVDGFVNGLPYLPIRKNYLYLPIRRIPVMTWAEFSISAIIQSCSLLTSLQKWYTTGWCS